MLEILFSNMTHALAGMNEKVMEEIGRINAAARKRLTDRLVSLVISCVAPSGDYLTGSVQHISIQYLRSFPFVGCFVYPNRLTTMPTLSKQKCFKTYGTLSLVHLITRNYLQYGICRNSFNRTDIFKHIVHITCVRCCLYGL